MENTNNAPATINLNGSSLVSDNLLNKVDTLVEQARKIGVLEGQKIAMQDEKMRLISDMEEAAIKAEEDFAENQKTVKIIFENNVNAELPYSWDMLGGRWVKNYYSNNSFITKVETTNIDNVGVLLGEALLDEIKTRENKFEQKVKETDERAKELVEKELALNEMHAKRTAEFNEKVSAEVENKTKILENRLKSENRLASRLVQEKKTLEEEFAYSIEFHRMLVDEYEDRIQVLKNQINLLTTKPSKLIKLYLRFKNSWWNSSCAFLAMFDKK